MRHAVLALLTVLAVMPALAAAAISPDADGVTAASWSAPATPPAAVATVLGLRLSEVLFHPADGEPGFVELLNAGPAEASLAGHTLVNERHQTFALPESLAPLAPGAVMHIVFDGGDRVHGALVHAPLADFLTVDAGAVELRGIDEALLDRVAWGAGQPDAVNLGRGGFSAHPGDLAPGTTIGRAPGSLAVGPLLWTIFDPAEASPGRSNPQPGVTVLLPLSGTILDRPAADLRWYPVPGAVAYRVQLTPEDDATFAAPLLDTTTDEPGLLTAPLPSGRYRWRVQAITASGAVAAFSPAQSLAIELATAQATGGVRALPTSLAQAPQVKVLLVPLIAQRKDTTMLLVDRDVAESGAHAWDVIHPGTDMSDPADNMNCVLAVAAMINAYAGGSLSQDRIGFEYRNGGGTPGADGDLMWGQGVRPDDFDDILTFALGVVPAGFAVGQDPAERDYFWQWVLQEIDAERPLAVAVPGHAVVVAGYAVVDGERRLLIDDPSGGQFSAVSLETFPVVSYYLTPLQVNARSDEPGISTDSDRDGVVDFDETERFGTDPGNPDSDGDKVEDKKDMLASMFDEHYGYAHSNNGRPDLDDDGTEMEMDKDSDDYGGESPGLGGCPDGMEDRNRDGKQNGTETSNFDPNDDRCLHARQVTDHAFFYTFGPVDGISSKSEGGGEIVLELWVTDTGEGRLEGTATYGGTVTTDVEVSSPACGLTSSHDTQTYKSHDLTVSGTRQGDNVEMIIKGDVQFTEVGVHPGGECGIGPVRVDMTYAATDLIPTLTGELVDGRYEDEQVTDYPSPSQGTITVHTLIEQKGQDDEGAPVG